MSHKVGQIISEKIADKRIGRFEATSVLIKKTLSQPTIVVTR